MSNDGINYRTEWLVSEASARQHITSTLEKLVSDFGVVNQRVIELGCGIGTNLRVFTSSNSVLGIEGMPEAVAQARANGLDVRQADLEEAIPVESANADVVLCIDVLEHLMHPRNCVAEARRLARPGALLVVNVPNHFDWKARLRILRGSGIDSQGYFPTSPLWAYPHVRFFSRAALDDLVLPCGFRFERDYSDLYLSFPKAHWWKTLGGASAMARARDRWPDLLSAGFFVVYRKS